MILVLASLPLALGLAAPPPLRHPVAEGEVRRAVELYLHRGVAPGTLQFDAPWTTAADSRVQVVSVRADAARSALALECRLPGDTTLLPFLVLVRLPAGSPALAQPAASPSLHPPAPALVAAGHVAALTIATSGFALTSNVMPLQSGRAGDRIRVVNLSTHAVLAVEVTGPNQVRSMPRTLEVRHAGR